MSCDLDHLYKLLFDFLMEAPDFELLMICREVSEKKMFENNVYIHVHDPRAGADSPLGSIAFYVYNNFLSNWLFAAIYLLLNDFNMLCSCC